MTLVREPDRLVVTGALRLPHRPYSEQIDAIRPLLEAADVVCFDRGGVGDSVGELLPTGAIPILITSGDAVSKHGASWHVGKTKLIGDLLHLARAGRLIVPAETPGAASLRAEMMAFYRLAETMWLKLEAKNGHDDLVLACALAVVAARLGADGGHKNGVERGALPQNLSRSMT